MTVVHARLNPDVQIWRRAIGGVSSEPARLEAEACLGSPNHRSRRADLGLANGAVRSAPVHWAAGSDGEMNFGVTSLALP